MSSKAKNALLTVVALMLYVGFMVGMSFVFNLFWAMDRATTILYWVSLGIICFMVVVFGLFMALGKTDKGIGGMQLFFSIFMSFIPLLLRALCLIPYAGFYIALVLGIIVLFLYLITMLTLGANGKGEGNKKI
ncbi:MAG: hypothetical protein IJ318_00575 [Clostridia bacterium]|nr:hypothetical protein [Clostridia bacterium]